MLAMLGVPPLMGFASRWRLYETALAQAPWVLALYVASSMMALIAYVLALTRYWWGPSSDELPKGPEPWLLRVSLVTLVIVLLVGGIWPHGVASLHLDLPNLPALEPGLWRLP
jgi:multicomponent Na+:H+ antiporter subunit D